MDFSKGTAARKRRAKLEPVGDKEFCEHPAFKQADMSEDFILYWRQYIESDVCLYGGLKGKLRPDMTTEDIAPLGDSTYKGGWVGDIFGVLTGSGTNPWIVVYRGTVAEMIVALWNSNIRETWAQEVFKPKRKRYLAPYVGIAAAIVFIVGLMFSFWFGFVYSALAALLWLGFMLSRWRRRTKWRYCSQQLREVTDWEFAEFDGFLKAGVPQEFILRWRPRFEEAIGGERFRNRLDPGMTLGAIEELEISSYVGEWQLEVYDKIVKDGGDPSFMKRLDCTVADMIVGLWHAETRSSGLG